MQTQQEVMPETMPLERLEAEITELAGHLAAAECRWLLLVGEYDRRSGYEEWGCRTCANWLSWHCGLDPRAARERVRVARALEELPLITAEFGAGKLSYSKVRALTRVATPANEYLRYEWADDGSLVGHFRIPPEMAAIFIAGVEQAREHVPPEPTDGAQPVDRNGPAEPSREFATTNCDALIMMAESVLAGGSARRSGGDRFQIVINADADVLADDADGTCELDGGPALAPETVRRIACDASIVHAVHDAVDRLVTTSRKTSSVPASTRRMVHARDRGCRFPGCGARIFTHVHHVRHRARGGSNDLTNLVELCWFHHHLVHEADGTFDSTQPARCSPSDRTATSFPGPDRRTCTSTEGSNARTASAARPSTPRRVFRIGTATGSISTRSSPAS